jgi:hypothetical protein
MSRSRLLAAALGLVAAASSPLRAQYMPVGPQHDVALSTILDGGWTQCYAASFGTPVGNSAERVLSSCTGAYLLMGGRATGASSFLLLAAGKSSDITTNTGAGTSNTHAVNGAEWYYASNWSWGFAPLGASVSLSSCDTQWGDDRMCLHTLDWTGGYRIGNVAGLNGSESYEKVFFQRDELDPTTPNTTTPEPATWSLMGGGLLAMAFAVRRRRSA